MTTGFTAVVLAGDRTANDPVAKDAGVSCKAIADICGTPMVIRVLEALLASRHVTSIVLCGPAETAIAECPQLAEFLKIHRIRRVDNLQSPGRSVEAAFSMLAENSRILLTTADHALLQTEVVDYFIEHSIDSDADATVALVTYESIYKAFPEVRRTVLKFSDGGICGCNLFTFLSMEGRKLVPFWRDIEQQRKRPWRMLATLLGFSGVIRYLVASLPLSEALARVSRQLELDIKPIVLPYPIAGIDVDTAQDRRFVEGLLCGDRARRS